MTNACSFHICSDLPEHIDIRFGTNGLQGGDAGHGGYAILEITWGAGSFEIIHGDGHLVFKALGDWELEGMIEAIIKLGDTLRILSKP